MRSFLLILAFFLSVGASALRHITLDDMRQRYAEFIRQEPMDTTISRENDEVVKSSYHCYEKKGEKYKNPRIKDPKDYSYMLTERLRTPEYPDRRHYWSLVDYERVNHHPWFKFPIRPIVRRRLKYINKSFIRYLALDSIEGLGPSSWTKAFRRKYYHPKHNFHYAKGVSDSLFLLGEMRNLLGYTVSPVFYEATIRKGHVRKRDFQRCEDEMGELYYDKWLILDKKTSRHDRVRRRLHGLDENINSSLTVVDHTIGKKSYDLLIIMLSNGQADAEVLSCTGEVGPEFERLRQHIRELPPLYFVRYWTVDGQALPGCYVQATIYPNGTWGFSMDKFLFDLRWRVWM